MTKLTNALNLASAPDSQFTRREIANAIWNALPESGTTDCVKDGGLPVVDQLAAADAKLAVAAQILPTE